MLRSPSGKLVQIEHALTAVGSGQTSLGIKGNVAAPGFYLKLVRARVYRLCDLMGELVFLVFSVKYWCFLSSIGFLVFYSQKYTLIDDHC